MAESEPREDLEQKDGTDADGAEAPETEAAVDETPSEATDPLAEAEARAQENWERVLRLTAEIDNLHKRAERDVAQAHRFGLERFAGDLLPVLDSLELALKSGEPDGEVGKAVYEGVEMTLKLFQDTLARFGIERIEPQGEAFDPAHHEAMTMVPSADVAPDHVLEVVQPGYILNGRLLRAARVVVARAPD